MIDDEELYKIVFGNENDSYENKAPFIRFFMFLKERLYQAYVLSKSYEKVMKLMPEEDKKKLKTQNLIAIRIYTSFVAIVYF